MSWPILRIHRKVCAPWWKSGRRSGRTARFLNILLKIEIRRATLANLFATTTYSTLS
jgi:hypothetical protein